MTTVEEIEQAAAQLTPADFDRLVSWVGKRHQELWKDQLEKDSAAGKLDFLFSEAVSERQAGQLHEWPVEEE